MTARADDLRELRSTRWCIRRIDDRVVELIFALRSEGGEWRLTEECLSNNQSARIDVDCEGRAALSLCH